MREGCTIIAWDQTPSFPQRIIDEALERDPSAGAAEYNAIFRSDIEGFLAKEVVDGAIVRGLYKLPPKRFSYKAFVDPSGGSSDSMTLAIGHNENGIAILDLIREVIPPSSPQRVTAEFPDLLRVYGMGSVCGDHYAGQWVSEQFRQHGIIYEASELTTLDIYREALPLFMTGKVQLLDHKRLATQLVSLEQRVSRSGRDSIGNPVGGS